MYSSKFIHGKLKNKGYIIHSNNNYKLNMYSNKSYVTNKRKRYDKDEREISENSDDITSEENKILRMIGNFHHHDDSNIYRSGNHIYFVADINMKNIDILNRILNKLKSEIEDIKQNLLVESAICKPIYLHIVSNGGDLFAGFRAIDLLNNCNFDIHTVVEGTACSAGALIYLAGKKRYMTENSYLLLHQLSSFSGWGTYEMIKDDADNNKKFMDRIVEYILGISKGKFKKKKLEELLKHDLYLSHNDCIGKGLCDGLYKDI